MAPRFDVDLAPSPATERLVELQLHQWLAHVAPEQFVALVTGLGGGKTWFGAIWIVLRAIAFPESVHLATVNTFTQAYDFVVPALERACDVVGVPFRWLGRNGVPTLFIDVGDRVAEIRVRSSDDPELLRGPEYGSWWADEVRDADPEVWNVLPLRLRCKNVDVPRALVTTTPNGRDILWRKFVKGSRRTRMIDPATGMPIRLYRRADRKGRSKWLCVNGDTRLNRHVHEDYSDVLEETLDDRRLRQERGGEFIGSTDLFYYAFDARRNVSKRYDYDYTAPLFVTLDFNVSPDTALIIQEIEGKTVVVDEITAWRGGTHVVCDAFLGRYPDRIGSRAPIIYGDSSGHHNDTRSGTSDYGIWTDRVRGATIRARKSNGLVRDGQNAVNDRFWTKKYGARLLIHPRCENLIEDLEAVKPNDAGDIDKRDKKTTHWTDALRYYVIAEWPSLLHLDRTRFDKEDRQLWKKPS